jgi:hypothetical protein
MSKTPDDPPNKPVVNHLVLGALGRAFAKVGQNREIEEWQHLGADLITKADAQSHSATPTDSQGTRAAPE